MFRQTKKNTTDNYLSQDSVRHKKFNYQNIGRNLICMKQPCESRIVIALTQYHKSTFYLQNEHAKLYVDFSR